MKAKSLIGFVLLAGIVLSALEWISIENTWIAIPAVLITVIFSSFLYLGLYKTVHNIDMSTSEFAMELFKDLCRYPDSCLAHYMLWAGNFLQRKGEQPGNSCGIHTNTCDFPDVIKCSGIFSFDKKIKPVTEQKIIDALRELEKRLNVHIENVYLLDRGLERAEVNAYQVGLRKFRIFVTEKLLSALSAEENTGRSRA